MKRTAAKKSTQPNHRRLSRKRLAVIAFLLLVLVPGSAYALTALGHQTLPKPVFVKATIVFSCTSPSLVNVTDPTPLFSGHNGTAVYGCTLTSTGVSPAFQVVTAGSVNATLTLPANVTISLLPNPGSLGPQSQADCAAGIPLEAGLALQLPVGTYSYCESFADPSNLVDVTTSWFQI